MEPKSSIPHSQGPTTCLHPEPDQSSPYLPIPSWGSVLISSSHLCLCLPSGLFPPRCPHQNPVFTSPLHHACHMPHPSHSSLFLSPVEYLVSSTEHEAPRYVVFSTPLLSRPNILLSTLFSNTLSLCSALSVTDQAAHPYKRAGSCISNI
jgi:hypothetical protein